MYQNAIIRDQVVERRLEVVASVHGQLLQSPAPLWRAGRLHEYVCIALKWEKHPLASCDSVSSETASCAKLSFCLLG